MIKLSVSLQPLLHCSPDSIAFLYRPVRSLRRIQTIAFLTGWSCPLSVLCLTDSSRLSWIPRAPPTHLSRIPVCLGAAAVRAESGTRREAAAGFKGAELAMVLTEQTCPWWTGETPTNPSPIPTALCISRKRPSAFAWQSETALCGEQRSLVSASLPVRGSAF